MAMKISVPLYNEIVSKYKTYGTLNCLQNLVSDFPDVPEMTLECIIHQVFQRRMEKEYWEHSKIAPSYYERYLKAETEGRCGILLEMAKEADLSPALIGRMIIEQHYTRLEEQKNPNMSEEQRKELRRKIVSHVKNTTLIEDGRLAAEIQMCNMHDVCYGPVADRLKRAIGSDYERYLKGILKDLGVHFYTEPKMRGSGFDRTPDIRLKLPLCVEGKAINWIESKASFGDMERHKDYLRNQYIDYRKRFGPGLIIYWFGYLEELVLFKRRDLLVAHSMPTEITFMNPDRIPPEKDPRSAYLDCEDLSMNVE